MTTWIRRLPALMPAFFGLVCAGCITVKNFEEAPPAQLDLRPPQPITTALPPLKERRVSREAIIGRVPPETNVSQPSPLADLIMGRSPPPSPAPLMPPQSLEITNAPTLLPLSKEDSGMRDAGRKVRDTKPITPPLLHSNLPPPTSSLAPRSSPLVPRPLSFRQIIAIQTLLDRRNFSCNCADGRIGFRTRAALRAWQEARGLPPTSQPDAATLADLGDMDHVFTNYTVTAEDHTQLTQNPTTWLGRSQVQRLGYTTILEAVAERGHATQQAIRDLNPQVTAWPDPPAGTVLAIPDVNPPANGKPPHAARIRISIGGKLVRVYDGADKQIAQFPCSIARDPKKREPCEISVAAIAPNPNYVFDPALFSEDPESASIPGKLLIPPGPRNPVGVAWVGLSKTGYGMHGTPKPEDIGKTESHGCFRLANWNALKLLRMVEIGTPVSVEE